MATPNYLLEPPDEELAALWDQRKALVDEAFEEELKGEDLRYETKFFLEFVEGVADGRKCVAMLKKLGRSWMDFQKLHFLDQRLYKVFSYAAKLGEDYRQMVREEEADRRAVDGTKKGIWYKGKRVGHELEYSDTLLLALLKAGDPDRFSDRKDIRHSGGVQLNLNVTGVRDGRGTGDSSTGTGHGDSGNVGYVPRVVPGDQADESRGIADGVIDAESRELPDAE
jgi:hypothetical protein